MLRITPTDWQTQVMKIRMSICSRKINKFLSVSFDQTFLFKRKVWKGDHLIFHYPNARRPVVIPKYREITVTVIMNNMRTVGMTRQQYFELFSEI
jgi:hypothetical protein